jgi:hypothetical protein
MCYRALLASQSGLALAIVAGVLNRVPIAVSEERRESYIKTNVRMLTHRWGMLVLWLCFTDNESVPVSISSEYQVTSVRSSFDGPMQLDLEGGTQLLGDTEMFAIEGKLKVRLVLTQWNGVPSIRLFEARKATLLTQFSQGKETFEGFIQAIGEHLDSGSGYMFATTAFEASRQIVLHEEFPRLLIRCFGVCQHLIVEVPRLREAGHEFAGLLFIWIQAVFKRSHATHFTANKLNCQVVGGIPHAPAAIQGTRLISPWLKPRALRRGSVNLINQ